MNIRQFPVRASLALALMPEDGRRLTLALMTLEDRAFAVETAAALGWAALFKAAL